MSTRATYQFDSLDFGRQTFYIHHDGYLSGAAKYFRKALEFTVKESYFKKEVDVHLGQLAARFFRANEKASFTSAAEDHGDTEFHYVVSGQQLVAYQRRPFGASDEQQWVEKFRGSVKEFVTHFNSAEEVA